MALFRKRQSKEHWFSYRKKFDRAQEALEQQPEDLYADKNWSNARKQATFWTLGGVGILVVIVGMVWGASRADVAFSGALEPSVVSPPVSESTPVTSAPGSVSGGVSQSSEGGEFPGFTLGTATEAGVLEAREYTSIHGDSFEGKYLPEWAARSYQHTKLLQKRYPALSSYIKAWKVGEREDGTEVMYLAPSPLFPEGYSFEIKFQNGSFEENAYEPLFHSYLQGFNDIFPWSGEEYWVGFQDVEIKGDGELRKVDKVSSVEEFFHQSPSTLVINISEGSPIGLEEEQTRVAEIATYLRQGKSFSRSWTLLVNHGEEGQNVYTVQPNGVVSKTN